MTIDRRDCVSTPLTEACICRAREHYPERLALVKLLLKYNADVNFNCGGWTALDMADQENSQDLALEKHLQKIGAERLGFCGVP